MQEGNIDMLLAGVLDARSLQQGHGLHQRETSDNIQDGNTDMLPCPHALIGVLHVEPPAGPWPASAAHVRCSMLQGRQISLKVA